MGKLADKSISPFLLSHEFGNMQGVFSDADANFRYLTASSTASSKLDDNDPTGRHLHRARPVSSAAPSDLIFMAPPTPFANLLLPLYSHLRLLSWSHFKIVYDPATQTFLYVPGGLLRKLLCYVLFILATSCTYSNVEVHIYHTGRSQLTAIMKVAQYGYVAMNVAFFYVLQARGRHLSDVLSHMQRLTVAMEAKGCAPPNHVMCKRKSVIIIVMLCVYGIVYVLEPFITSYSRSETTGFCNYFADGVFQAAAIASGLAQNDPSILAYKMSDNLPPWAVVIIAGCKCLLDFSAALVWISGILMQIYWAVSFRMVYSFFMNILRKSASSDTLQDIRKFNMISSVLEKFNYAMGPLILVMCMTCVIHFSVHGIRLVDSSASTLNKLVVGFGLVYVAAMLVTGATVNSEACKIFEVVKARFQDRYGWSELHGRCSETTQGIVLLLNDIQTNNIGFKGLGFFTITYSFIGTVLSALSTFAIVVLQFQQTKP